LLLFFFFFTIDLDYAMRILMEEPKF